MLILLKLFTAASEREIFFENRRAFGEVDEQEYSGAFSTHTVADGAVCCATRYICVLMSFKIFNTVLFDCFFLRNRQQGSVTRRHFADVAAVTGDVIGTGADVIGRCAGRRRAAVFGRRGRRAHVRLLLLRQGFLQDVLPQQTPTGLQTDQLFSYRSQLVA